MKRGWLVILLLPVMLSSTGFVRDEPRPGLQHHRAEQSSGT